MLLPIITAIAISAVHKLETEPGVVQTSPVNQHSDFERKLSLTHLTDGETEPHQRLDLYIVKPGPTPTYPQPSLTPQRFRIMVIRQISLEVSITKHCASHSTIFFFLR